jgi:hypothetical protein
VSVSPARPREEASSSPTRGSGCWDGRVKHPSPTRAETSGPSTVICQVALQV